MFQLFKDPQYDFLKPRRIFLAASAVACAGGGFACGLLWPGKANLGTDFGGGVLLHYSAKQDLEIEKIRGAVKDAGYTGAQIQQVKLKDQAGFRLAVRIKRDLGSEVGKTGDMLLTALAKDFPQAGFSL